MGILVKDSFFSTYTINVIDKSFQDILAIQLKHVYTDHIIVVYSCYLPPDGSPWSNCTYFFGHLKGLAQAKIIKKSMILFWLFNMTI